MTHQPSKWPPSQAWAQEAIAHALGFPNHHAARTAIAKASENPQAPSSSIAGWTIHNDNSIAASSMVSNSVGGKHLQIPLVDLQGNLLLLGEDKRRKRELEELAAMACQAAMPVLIVQGAASAGMNLGRTFSVHSFRAYIGYADTISCVLKNGSAGQIIDAMVALMDEVGSDNSMWKGRAISMVAPVIEALTHLRDQHGESLDTETIRSRLVLDKYQTLSLQRDLPAQVIQPLRAYLRSIPGYNEGATKQSETTLDQHGYLQMQFTRVLGAVRTPLSITNRMSITLDQESRQAKALATVMNEWVRQHQGGLILLDGLDQGSALYTWLVGAVGRVRQAMHGVVIGARGLSDLPEQPLRDRILDRLEHWVVTKGQLPRPKGRGLSYL